MASVHPWARDAFEQAAADYHVGRPGYPQEATDWMANRVGLTRASTIVDVGAGTGKLTERLIRYGAHVIAVEPVAAMRKHLQRLPSVTVIDGTAEQLPLADGSADLITVGQAIHWFDANLAVPELRRVLRPQGWLAIARNDLDLRNPASATLATLIARFRSHPPVDRGAANSIEHGDAFVLDARRFFPMNVDAALREIQARAASESSITLADSEQRDQLRRAIADTFTTEPVQLTYSTQIALYRPK